MNAPLTPHPTSFPPTVDATILFCLSLLKLSNSDAINDLITLKSNGTIIIEKATLSLRIHCLQDVLNSRPSLRCKRTLRQELEQNLARETVNFIADIDDKCVAVLRKYEDVRVEDVIKESKEFGAMGSGRMSRFRENVADMI